MAKRVEKTTSTVIGSSPVIDDTSIIDITRTIRTANETLHDDTRALMRRIAADTNGRFDELDHRFDAAERHRREDMDEWRSIMKPSMFQKLVDQLDKFPAAE